MASYPSSIKSFTTKLSGQVIQDSFFNEPQDEITAVETGLLAGFGHNLFPSATGLRDLGTSSLGWQQLFLDLGTITADAQAIDIKGVWNNAGITFVAIKSNITDTLSAAASLLIDLQVGGSSKFKVDKAGNITAAAYTSGSVLFAGASGAISQDNANLFWDNTNDVLSLGPGGVYAADFAVRVQISRAGNVGLGFRDSTQALNAKHWDILSTGSQLQIRAVDDAYSVGLAAITLSRSGGTPTAVTISNGSLHFGTDNTQDIGASGANRPRTAHLGTSLVIGPDVGSSAVLRISGDVRMSGSAFGLNTDPVAGIHMTIVSSVAGNVPLRLKGAAAQSGNMVELQNSVGTGLLTINFQGDILAPDNGTDLGGAANRFKDGYFGTSVRIGTTPIGEGLIRVPASSSIFSMGSGSGPGVVLGGATLTHTSGNPSTFYWAINASPASASTGTYYGPIYADVFGQTANLGGAQVISIILNTGYNVSSGTLASAYGVQSSIISQLAGGTITNAFAYYAGSPGGTGTITNRYGFYAASQSGFGIYAAGAGDRNFFAGSIEIGTNPADAGHLRLPSAGNITRRNVANSNNLSLIFSHADTGVQLQGNSGAGSYVIGGDSTNTADLGLSTHVWRDGWFGGKIVVPTIGPASGQQHTLPAVTSDTIALLAATQILTNKTFNLTSNTLSGTKAQFNTALSDGDFLYVGDVTATLPFLVATMANIPASAGAVLVRVDATSETWYELEYEDATNREVSFEAKAVAFTSLRITWRSPATTGDVKWFAEVREKGDADVLGSGTIVASGNVVDTTKGTANQLNEATISASYTPGANKRTAIIRIFRQPGDAADTLGNTAKILYIEAL